MENLLEWLQKIYEEDFCDGSWEHEHGLSIGNIDNPGWDFTFDLKDTDIEDIPFEEVYVINDENDWYQCWIKDSEFRGWGGARNLTDILLEFKNWYIKASAIADERKAGKIE